MSRPQPKRTMTEGEELRALKQKIAEHKLKGSRKTKQTVDAAANPRHNITAKGRERIYLRDKGRCVDCGLVCGGGWKIWKPSVKHFELNGTHEIHHIIPVIKGGKTTEDNLILLCIPCHLARHKIEKGEQ